jgi:hypothetical protein
MEDVNELFLSAAEKWGIDLPAPLSFPKILRDAGFFDVRWEVFR